MPIRKNYGDRPTNRDQTTNGREWKPEKTPIDYLRDKGSSKKEREQREHNTRHNIETKCVQPGCKNEATDYSSKDIGGTCITHTDYSDYDDGERFEQIMSDDSPRWDDGITRNPEM